MAGEVLNSDLVTNQAIEETVELPTEPAFTMKDVDEAKELFTRGKRDYICENYADACSAFSQVCAVFSGYYGETAIECAEPYYFYGRTLLELARKEPGVVANAVQGCHLDSADEDEQGPKEDEKEALIIENEDPEEDKEEIREKVYDALEENAELLEKSKETNIDQKEANPGVQSEESGTNGESASIDDSNKAAGEPGETAVVEEPGESDGDGGSEAGSEDANSQDEVAEEISNLQLSWEMLDLARAILEKHNDGLSRERLADCRLALGEQAIEDEEYDKALQELEACIGLQKELFKPNDRRIALSYYNIGLVHGLNDKYDLAAKAYKEAVAVLSARLIDLKAKMDGFNESADQQQKADVESEIKDLTSLIEEVQTRIQDCIESGQELVVSKKALTEFETSNAHDITAAKNGVPPPTDISHLVHKPVKRTTDTEIGTEGSPKKVKFQEETTHENGTDKNGDGQTSIQMEAQEH